MRVVRSMAAAAVFLVLASDVAWAQQEQGDKSATVFGNLSVSDGSTSGSVFGGLGYFFTRQLELQGNVGIMISSSPAFGGGTDTFVNTILGAGANYNFSTEGQKTFPYVGGEFGAVVPSGGDATAIMMRPHAGINSFLNRNIALNVDAGVQLLSASGFTSTVVDARFGFKVVF